MFKRRFSLKCPLAEVQTPFLRLVVLITSPTTCHDVVDVVDSFLQRVSIALAMQSAVLAMIDSV